MFPCNYLVIISGCFRLYKHLSGFYSLVWLNVKQLPAPYVGALAEGRLNVFCALSSPLSRVQREN